MNGEARQGGVYLEPGERAELARAAQAAASAAGLHPRALLLHELAVALDRMADQPFGCLLAPATATDSADAARHCLLPNSAAPEGSHEGARASTPAGRRVAHPA